jgi:hypothetical protein
MRTGTWWASWALLVVAALPAAAQSYQQEVATLPRHLPKEVRDFIDRRAACLYFKSELPGQPGERQTEIESTMARLRCGAVCKEESHLQKQYSADQPVLHTLEKSRDWRTDD